MIYERLWERLVSYLNEWASAREVPGGLVVAFEEQSGTLRTVQIVVTPDEWDDYISTIYGVGDPAATVIRSALLAVPAGMSYLVYDTYDWTASAVPTVPRDSPPRPDGGGEWLALDRDGSVTSRFADWVEPE